MTNEKMTHELHALERAIIGSIVAYADLIGEKIPSEMLLATLTKILAKIVVEVNFPQERAIQGLELAFTLSEILKEVEAKND
jgi:hypothetical protein